MTASKPIRQLVAIAGLVFSCTIVGRLSGDERLHFFETNIRPVLVEHCYECHSIESQKSQGELLLDSREAIRAGGASGPAVVPGDVDASLILDALRQETFKMPPAGKLDDTVIANFEQWISSGASDPREDSRQSSSPLKVDWDEASRFWAFQPLQHSTVPQLDASRLLGPIDAFVQARLQQAGLTANQEASKEVWLRRVTFDLHGVPPTPDERDEFLRDHSPDAYERTVDRLLASPRYGERYGRHWLDLVRYADSNGADENHAYPVAWRFRDYVVDAINADIPYDRFVMEQLAGDLLPAESESERARLLTATGMLVIGPKMLAEQDKPKLVADMVDEQLDTVGKLFLGLTLGCARCHDHKFDPIKMSDYYALAGIFHSTKSMKHLEFVSQWNERELPNSQRIAERAEHLQNGQQSKQELKQLEISLRAPWLEKQLSALQVGLKWRAAEYLASDSEVAELQLDDSQWQRIKQFIDRSNWRDAKSLEVLGAELRAFVKLPEPLADSELLHSAIIAALRDAANDLVVIERDEKGKPKDARLVKLDRQLYGKNGPLQEIDKLEELIAPADKDHLNRLREAVATHEKNAPTLDLAMAADEGPVKLAAIHVRGNHLQTIGEPLLRNVPKILQAVTPAVTFPSDRSGRLELAQWLVSPSHPLTSRVIVNRLWQYHFGEGIVRSSSNFGLRGELPTHPELLDHLANELIDSDWSMKALHRKIVLSATYRMTSTSHSQGELVDPDNSLLWKRNRRRLEAEPLRDSLLVISDEIDWQVGGQAQAIYGDKFEDTLESKTIYDAARRTIYLPINRAALEEFFATFDYVDSAVALERRPVTTVPHQALFLLNHRLALHAGWRLARRLEQHSSHETERLRLAYQILFSRDPRDEELAAAQNFLQYQRATTVANSNNSDNSADSADHVADFDIWVSLCRSLLVANEFIYVD